MIKICTLTTSILLANSSFSSPSSTPQLGEEVLYIQGQKSYRARIVSREYARGDYYQIRFYSAAPQGIGFKRIGHFATVPGKSLARFTVSPEASSLENLHPTSETFEKGDLILHPIREIYRHQDQLSYAYVKASVHKVASKRFVSLRPENKRSGRHDEFWKVDGHFIKFEQNRDANELLGSCRITLKGQTESKTYSVLDFAYGGFIRTEWTLTGKKEIYRSIEDYVWDSECGEIVATMAGAQSKGANAPY